MSEAKARALAAEKAQDIAERRASTAATALEKAEKTRDALEARALRAEERADASVAAIKELAASVATGRAESRP